MKIIKDKDETVIYPLLEQDWTEQEDDYSIVMDSTGFIIDGRMWNDKEIEKVIEGLEEILIIARIARLNKK